MNTKVFNMFSYFLCLCIPEAMGVAPGTFYWKPRLMLDLRPATPDVGFALSKQNLNDAKVMLIDGFSAGTTMVAVCFGIAHWSSFPHLHLRSPDFYTNSYRWVLRHIDLLQMWLKGNGGNYAASHKLWKRRYFYMDRFVPDWLSGILSIFNIVKAKDWANERGNYSLFEQYAESTFGDSYGYPGGEKLKRG